MALYMEELKRRDEKDRRIKRKETMEKTLATWGPNGRGSGKGSGQTGALKVERSSKLKDFSRGMSC